MSVKPQKPKDVTTETYAIAGTGAITAGAGILGANNARLKAFARRTVEAFGGSSDSCDAFIRQNKEFLHKAANSGRGFFGKVQDALGPRGVQYKNDAVSEAGNRTIKEYWARATEKIGDKFQGERLKEEINKLANKLFADDLYKSYKGVNKIRNAAIIAGAVVIGAIGACVIHEIRKEE